MGAPPEIIALVDRFSRNVDAYHSSQYNETQARREFIDPFFKCLGWDIDNTQGFAEAYKDVIHEDAIKVGGHTKAPDYSFRIGGTRKFFLEAKRPSVNLKTDPEPAFQLRRYGWSARLPLSILTDFAEFAVYDCRVKPAQTDNAAAARIRFLTFTDYADQWDSIAEIFSKDSVLKGSFDKYAESSKLKKGTATVDAAFLKEIEGWREHLARNIALRNNLSQRELNYAVQVTIDRILFLRMCEDRGVELYGQLAALQSGAGVYGRLNELFRKADQRYNSGLFHFEMERDRSEPPDELTAALAIDDKPLKEIFKGLYYPDSPYEFSVLPAEILGQVYEQFLGKVIRLAGGHRAVVEEKPEVRKAGGVYYTPTYIVDYIVKGTVGKLLDGKTPKQAGKLKILDPACGSGSFLLGAYQFLLDWHRDRYFDDGPDKHAKELFQGRGGAWHLTSGEKKRILLNNIFGVDIDPQAVEVTKLSLLLKVLEGESQQTLEHQLLLYHERALPDLANNIRCGNSLIGPDFYDAQQMTLLGEEERYRINVFDWNAAFPAIMKAGGFDAVIGNPPYDVVEKERGAASWPHGALLEYVRERNIMADALGGKLNLFRFFLVRSVELTRIGGRFGMIMPLALLGDASCSAPRRFLMQNCDDIEGNCFPQKDNASRRIFAGAKLSTGIITCTRVRPSIDANPQIHVRTFPWNSFDDPFREYRVRFDELKKIDPENVPVPLCGEKDWELCRKIHEHERVSRMGECAWLRITRGEINQTIYRRFIRGEPSYSRLLKGVEVGQYNERISLKQGKREYFDERAFVKENRLRPVVGKRRIATQRITGVDERLRIVATIIEPPCYFADSTNSVVVEADSDHRMEYVLGLLNSTLFQWRFKATSTNNNVGTNELACMPLRLIEFQDPVDKSLHDRMVEMVSHMLERHKRLAAVKTPQEKKSLEMQIAATDRRIDNMVYELYGLAPDEIKIVEQDRYEAASAGDADNEPATGGNGEAEVYTPYQPALDAGISEEMDRLNFRRLRLAERKSRGQLTPEEETEFDNLQGTFFAYLDTLFPRPSILDDDRLEKLEQKYRNAKTS